MKKKLISLLICAALSISFITGCSGNQAEETTKTGGGNEVASEADGDDDKTGEDDVEVNENTGDEAEESGEVEPEAVTTVGPDDGIPLEMWTFVELHSTYYAEMLNLWNEENPDKQIQITFTTYPYADMHNKLMLANQSGIGAPDMCDVEIGQFPNFLQGQVQFRALNDVIEPYQKDIVQSRLDIYSKDGDFYGIDFHVGATVMFYNTKLLEAADIDYTTIKTWDDFTAAGEKLRDATDGETMMTSVDTAGVDWMWLSMAQHGEDYTDDEGAPTIEQPSIIKMVQMQQGWLNDGIAMVSPGGHVDMETGFANLGDEKIAAFPKAMWFMSRFLNYLPEMTDTWAIAPCPVFEEGQPRSVGVGGTGTVVSLQSDNADLAAEFLAYAKLSYEGNVKVWEILGFDTLNTTIWSDEEITTDTSNQYISYFVNNPFDALNEIKDEIGKIKVGRMNPAINEQFNLTILNNCFENGADIESELATAQNDLEIEY